MKREPKDEIVEEEMMDLPLIEFDPNEENDSILKSIRNMCFETIKNSMTHSFVMFSLRFNRDDKDFEQLF